MNEGGRERVNEGGRERERGREREIVLVGDCIVRKVQDAVHTYAVIYN